MVDCTDQQLEMFLERALALQIFPSSEDPTAPTDTGLVYGTFIFVRKCNLLYFVCTDCK